MTGKKVGARRFSGHWPLDHQVMIKKLYDNKSIDDSLRHISFYPFKAPVSFNYENTAPKHGEELPEGDPANFSDEALALIAWLQHGIGHESLRLAINWPSLDRERRGRKAKLRPIQIVTDEKFEQEFGRLLEQQGLNPPRETKNPIGQTDLNELFEKAPINDTISFSDDTEGG